MERQSTLKQEKMDIAIFRKQHVHKQILKSHGIHVNAKKNHIKIKFNDKKWFVIVLIHKNKLHQIRPFGKLSRNTSFKPPKDVFVQLPRELPKSQGISVIAPQLHQIRPFWKLTPNPTITHLDRRRYQTQTRGQFSI